MKRLIQKLIHRSLNSLMGGASLPLSVNHVIAIEGSKNMSQKTIDLPFGKGKLTYRIPTVIEQLRFQSAARWYDETIKDGSMRLSYAIEAMAPFVLSLESSHYKSFDDVLNDRVNANVLSEIALDLCGKNVSEPEKKP